MPALTYSVPLRAGSRLGPAEAAGQGGGSCGCGAASVVYSTEFCVLTGADKKLTIRHLLCIVLCTCLGLPLNPSATQS